MSERSAGMVVGFGWESEVVESGEGGVVECFVVDARGDG